MKPRLDALDTELALAVAELERTVPRIPYGRVMLTVERIAGMTTAYDVEIERTTVGEIERVMQEMPMSPGRSG